MKRSIILMAGIAAIAVTACSGGGGADQIQAGQWEMVSKVTQLEAPGAPAEQLGPMQAMLNREQTNQTCITPERAANPLAQFREQMTRGQPGATCTTDEDTFAGGVIRVRVTCRSAGGQPGQGAMSMEGTFTATTLQATMTVNGEGPGAGGAPQSVRMTTSLRGRRIGDCPAGSAPPANSQ